MLRITITLDRDEPRFEPGEAVSGTVEVSSDSSWQASYCDLMLFWRTEGQGDEDRGIVAETPLCAKGELAPPQLRKPFRLKLPDMPWTYHGVAIKVHWVLGAYAKQKGEKEESLEMPVIMHPRPDRFEIPHW